VLARSFFDRGTSLAVVAGTVHAGESPKQSGGRYMGGARLIDADRLIAIRIRERRIMCGLSQRRLGELIGVTQRQAQKYEYGINSVSAGRLYVIARELSVPLEYFFEGFEPNERRPLSRQRMLLGIVRNFGDIQNEKHQEAFAQFSRALAGR
jgi:transcriptional regulator with XRE-family HTH domain